MAGIGKTGFVKGSFRDGIGDERARFTLMDKPHSVSNRGDSDGFRRITLHRNEREMVGEKGFCLAGMNQA